MRRVQAPHGEQAAAGFEAAQLVQVRVGKDRRKLQNLVERRVRACGFGAVEDEAHAGPLNCLGTSANPKFQLVDFNRDVTVVVPQNKQGSVGSLSWMKAKKRN